MGEEEQNETSLGTRERILEAARRCFSREGYTGARVAEIAREAGVNPAVIYRYFAGKRELFDALEQPELDFPKQEHTARRAEIAQAAAQVFSQKGFAAASMDEIAERAGLSKGGLYVYFDSKQALLEAALADPRAFERIEQIFEGMLAKPGGEAQAGMRQIARAYLAMFERPEAVERLRIVLSEGVRDAEIARAYLEGVVQRGSQLVGGYLERMGYGPQAQLALAAQAFFGTLFSWALTHRILAQPTEGLPGWQESPQEVADLAVGLFLHGLEGLAGKE
ncbi:MAG: TetR/AcrR family transcriptional regulator [Chloroflexota bacterium]